MENLLSAGWQQKVIIHLGYAWRRRGNLTRAVPGRLIIHKPAQLDDTPQRLDLDLCALCNRVRIEASFDSSSYLFVVGILASRFFSTRYRAACRESQRRYDYR